MIISSSDPYGNSSFDYSILEIDADQITKNIFLGDKKCGENKQFLKDLGVRHIIVAGQQLKVHYPEQFNYLHIKVKDSPKEKIDRHFQDVCMFIESALKKGEGVFVHCAFGVSRSATLVIAFLIKKLKICFMQALLYVKRKRVVVKPNQGFQQQLKQWQNKQLIQTK